MGAPPPPSRLLLLLLLPALFFSSPITAESPHSGLIRRQPPPKSIATARGGGGGSSTTTTTSTPTSSITATATAFARGVPSFAQKNFFILAMAVAVGLARLAPSLGAKGGPLRPEVTVDKLATSALFVLSGLALPLRDIRRAATTGWRLIAVVQLFSLGAMPLLVAGLVRLLRAASSSSSSFYSSLLQDDTLDGLLVMASVPTTVNMCVVLTTAAGGDVAGAILNAVVGNLAGIVVTPLWLFRLLPQSPPPSSALPGMPP